MIRTTEELMNDIKLYMGDRISEESSISLLENISDTINDYNERVKDETDWKAKYERNDAEWKRKYTDRFFAPVEPDNDLVRDRKAESISFDDLFTRKD